MGNQTSLAQPVHPPSCRAVELKRGPCTSPLGSVSSSTPFALQASVPVELQLAPPYPQEWSKIVDIFNGPNGPSAAYAKRWKMLIWVMGGVILGVIATAAISWLISSQFSKSIGSAVGSIVVILICGGCVLTCVSASYLNRVQPNIDKVIFEINTSVLQRYPGCELQFYDFRRREAHSNGQHGTRYETHHYYFIHFFHPSFDLQRHSAPAYPQYMHPQQSAAPVGGYAAYPRQSAPAGAGYATYPQQPAPPGGYAAYPQHSQPVPAGGYTAYPQPPAPGFYPSPQHYHRKVYPEEQQQQQQPPPPPNTQYQQPNQNPPPGYHPTYNM